MQDNHPKDFDEQFINQAWLEMSHLLDKEMPVQPKRRAAGWLWLLAWLFLILVLAGGAYYFYSAGESQKPTMRLSAPTARMESPVSSDTHEKQAKKKEQRSVGEAIGNQPKSLDSAPVAIPGKSVEPKKEGKTDKLQVLPAVKPHSPVNAGGKEAGAIFSGPDLEAIKARENAAVPLDEKTAPATHLRWNALAALPLTKAVSPSAPALAERPAELPQPIFRRAGILRLAAEGGAYFPGHSIPGGLSGGLAIEARPRASRLYLRTGAFFRWYKQRLNTTETVLHLENSFSKDPQPDGSFVNRTSQLTTRATITQTSYIQFPLLAGFQWKPRLAFESGLQAGFLISSHATSNWGLINETSSPGSPEAVNNTIYEFQGGAGNYILNNTSLDIIAALAYRPNHRTSLRLSYQYGLSDILASSREKAYIRGLQLSFAWYLIQ